MSSLTKRIARAMKANPGPSALATRHVAKAKRDFWGRATFPRRPRAKRSAARVPSAILKFASGAPPATRTERLSAHRDKMSAKRAGLWGWRRLKGLGDQHSRNWAGR